MLLPLLCGLLMINMDIQGLMLLRHEHGGVGIARGRRAHGDLLWLLLYRLLLWLC